MNWKYCCSIQLQRQNIHLLLSDNRLAVVLQDQVSEQLLSPARQSRGGESEQDLRISRWMWVSTSDDTCLFCVPIIEQLFLRVMLSLNAFLSFLCCAPSRHDVTATWNSGRLGFLRSFLQHSGSAVRIVSEGCSLMSDRHVKRRGSVWLNPSFWPTEDCF